MKAQKEICDSVWSVGLFVVGCRYKKGHKGLHSATVSDALDSPEDAVWATIVWSGK